MMIKLDVENYCHECREFKPEIMTEEYGCPFDETATRNTYIRCQHTSKCARIAKFLANTPALGGEEG